MKHGDTTAAFDPLHAFLERPGVCLCALAYMITGDWDLGIDAVARFLDAGLKNDALSEAPPLCAARRLVAAEAVAAIRPQLLESAARIAGMTANPEEWLGAASENVHAATANTRRCGGGPACNRRVPQGRPAAHDL